MTKHHLYTWNLVLSLAFCNSLFASINYFDYKVRHYVKEIPSYDLTQYFQNLNFRFIGTYNPIYEYLKEHYTEKTASIYATIAYTNPKVTSSLKKQLLNKHNLELPSELFNLINYQQLVALVNQYFQIFHSERDTFYLQTEDDTLYQRSIRKEIRDQIIGYWAIKQKA